MMYQQDLQQMTNGVPNTTPNPYYYQNANPYLGSQYQQRLYAAPQNGYLKGRPVLSLEEAKASQIDLDGSVHIFTDIGNKKIYTKQFNMDGTATLNVYALVENTEMPKEEDNLKMNDNYVTREEFNQVLNKLQSLFVKEEKKQSSNISF